MFSLINSVLPNYRLLSIDHRVNEKTENTTTNLYQGTSLGDQISSIRMTIMCCVAEDGIILSILGVLQGYLND